MDISPIIKVVGSSCNLNCDYCFYTGWQEKPLSIMPISKFEHLVSSIYSYSNQKRISIVWHGGEPLLASIDYYREICNIQAYFLKKNDIQFFNNVQTNATLISDEWASFFQKNKFHVGVSLDGPKEIHNLHRKNFSGEGSYELVMRGIGLLREYGFHPGVICVVNKDNISQPDELFEFFYSNNLSFKANDCTKSVSDEENESLQVDPEDFSQFLLRIFDLWIERNDPSFRITPLDDYVKGLLGYKTNICKLNRKCQQHLTFDNNGDVYPCDGYLGNNHNLGNVDKESFLEIVNKETFNKKYVIDRNDVIKNCGSCNWTKLCNGYCMRQWEDSSCSGNHIEKNSCNSLNSLWLGLSSRLKNLGYEVKY